jgi:hypothetical protein
LRKEEKWEIFWWKMGVEEWLKYSLLLYSIFIKDLLTDLG